MTRRRAVFVLAVLSVLSFAAALILVHGVGHQTVQGSKTDLEDPDAPAETTQARLECTTPASGPRLTDEGYSISTDLEDEDSIAEDDDSALRYAGVDAATASEVCGRVRVERLTHAGELGVLGLLLTGSAVLLRRGSRRGDAAVLVEDAGARRAGPDAGGPKVPS